ncbi:unnamed protein product [Rhizophagus irregularis]|nr:unnamed protein product [Rhizophagus irregularis]
MRVEGNKIVLGEYIMLNLHNELILDNGEPIADNITMNSVENNELILDNDEPMTDNITMDSVENKDNGIGKPKLLVKFLRLHSTPDGIVYGISTQDILIKTSYLQMIEEIENDRAISEKKDDRKKGYFIYQQLNKGKSHTIHISQKNMDVIKYPWGLGGEFPINSFYITDSVIPSLCTTKFTFLVTAPKNDLWHEFAKHCVWKYYALIWTDWEIWNVWEWDKRDYKHKIPKEQVEELII